MGQRLYAQNTGQPPPYPTTMELTCDGDHGLLPGASYSITGRDYIAMRADASGLGWRRVDGGGWRGPCHPR